MDFPDSSRRIDLLQTEERKLRLVQNNHTNWLSFGLQLGIETSNQLVASFSLSKDQGRFALPTFSLKGSPIQETCPAASTTCNRYLQHICHLNRASTREETKKYRNLDGTCNNLEKTSWGSSNTALQVLRLLPIRPVTELLPPETAASRV